MLEPDTLAYYLVLFGTIALLPLLILAAGLLMGKALNQSSRKHWILSSLPLLGILLAVLANPGFNSLLFVPGSNGRVAAMYEETTSEGFVGKTFTEFTQRYGPPDRMLQVGGDERNSFVYTCRPWFAYGWDELVVRTEKDVVVGIFIDD